MVQEDYILQFEKLLKKSFRKLHRPGLKKAGLLFSGGVDSSLTAKLAKDCNFSPRDASHGTSPTLLSLRTEKAKDVEHIKKAANFLDLPLVFVDVDEKYIKKELPKLKKILKEFKIEQNLMQFSLGLSMYFLAKRAKSLKLKACFCGQGSDELFTGYHKYKKVEGNKVQGNKLKELIRQEYERLKRVDEVRDMGIFKKFGLELFSPFLDKKVVKFSLGLPTDLLRNKKENKIIVRRLAQKLGLPAFIYKKPKKALQYSTGIQKLVRKALDQEKW